MLSKRGAINYNSTVERALFLAHFRDRSEVYEKLVLARRYTILQINKV